MLLGVICSLVLRYDSSGILDSIDPIASTVSLRFVQSFGTEGRPVAAPIPPSAEIYNCIVFQGKHIKDLTVCSEPEPPTPAMPAYPHDPAIVSVDIAGPSGTPGGPGPASLLRPGVAAASPVVGGPNVRPSMFGGLGIPPNEVAEPCCGPISPAARGPPHQPQLQAQPADGLLGSSGQQGDRQQNFSGGRGNAGNRGGGGRPAKGRGGRDTRKPTRGADGGRGYGDGPRGVVGELQGRPNAQLKSEVAEEFDFDAMNSKFEKPAVLEEAAELSAPGTAYDKNVSFFDSISCEALDKRAGAQQQQHNSGTTEDERNRRATQRQQNLALDVNTFGEGAAHYNIRHLGGRRGLSLIHI